MKLRFVLILALMTAFMLLWPVSDARSHCEIPCGIYDDSMRYDMLNEHIATIEKSMNMITELSAAGDKNYNQLVRWVVNKDDHADKFMEIVTQYFLTQRIKPTAVDAGNEYDDYVKHLTYFHEMLVYAMKCKQTVDKANINKLRELVGLSRDLYFKEHEH
ncbi:MAG: superoxide dismutase [candidate division Zixibacteria bacterium]|nr:superoxide dismutase [candidate division Zixibacteria bacterium]